MIVPAAYFVIVYSKIKKPKRINVYTHTYKHWYGFSFNILGTRIDHLFFFELTVSLQEHM